jgi:hypothetical protein
LIRSVEESRELQAMDYYDTRLTSNASAFNDYINGMEEDESDEEELDEEEYLAENSTADIFHFEDESANKAIYSLHNSNNKMCNSTDDSAPDSCEGQFSTNNRNLPMSSPTTENQLEAFHASKFRLKSPLTAEKCLGKQKMLTQRCGSTASTETNSGSNHSGLNNFKFIATKKPKALSDGPELLPSPLYAQFSSNSNRSSPISIPTSRSAQRNDDSGGYSPNLLRISSPKFLKYAKTDVLPCRRLRPSNTKLQQQQARDNQRHLTNNGFAAPSLLFHLEL